MKWRNVSKTAKPRCLKSKRWPATRQCLCTALPVLLPFPMPGCPTDSALTSAVGKSLTLQHAQELLLPLFAGDSPPLPVFPSSQLQKPFHCFTRGPLILQAATQVLGAGAKQMWKLRRIYPHLPLLQCLATWSSTVCRRKQWLPWIQGCMGMAQKMNIPWQVVHSFFLSFYIYSKPVVPYKANWCCSVPTYTTQPGDC